MKKLLTPRGYLSWTQVQMWLTQRDRYIRGYMRGEDINLRGAFVEFGKKTATALETGSSTDDELLNMLVASLPKYSSMEHEIRVPFNTENGQVDLLGKMDTFCPEKFSFREYKTGRVKWTMSRAEKHKQLQHYQAVIWLKHKQIDPVVYLDWAETGYNDNNQVCLTGRVESFAVEVNVQKILEYLALVGKVAKEIDEVYRRELASVT